MRALLLASALLLVAGCGGTEPADALPATCASLGLDAAGTMSATVRLFGADDTAAFRPACLRASVTAGRVVVRGIVLNGGIQSDVVLTALTTAEAASLDIATRQASATYATLGRTYAAAEGNVTVAVTAARVSGTFEFVTPGDAFERVVVAEGQFSVAR